MNSLIKKLKLIVNRVRFTLPSRLPKGVAEFEAWADSILETYDLPNNDSFKFALAGAILHLEATTTVEVNLLIVKLKIPFAAFKSKRFFGHYLHKMSANEVAASNLQAIKAKQQEEIRKAQETGKVVQADFSSSGSGS